MKPQFLISTTSPGSGKTIFAMGLTCALRRRGIKVQPYKCGAEITDTQLLSLSANNEAVNLDTWLTDYTHVQYIYNKYGEKADTCIIEGNGALFDGYKRMQGSSAEIAKLLNIPVILLINARIAGYSIASIIYGFKHFHPQVKIIAVVFNQITSSAQYAYLKEACSDAGVDCLGYLPYQTEFKLPSKHSCITLTTKRTLDAQIDRIADQLEKHVNINRLLDICNRNFPCQYTLPYSSDIETEINLSTSTQIKIAIARDPAFNFIYKENIARLSQIGKISYFSPVYGSELPEADLVYLPGGYPELFARQLHRRHKLMESLRNFINKGGKVFAECGGMVFLGRSLTVKEGGSTYQMCNILPIDFITNSSKLHSGYRKITYNEMELKGYDFHYSYQQEYPKDLAVTQITNIKGIDTDFPLFRYKNVIASFTHWYWGDKDILDLWK